MAPTIPARDAKGRAVRGGPGLNPKGRPRTGLALSEMIREVAGQPGVMRAWVELVFDVAFGRSVCIDAAWLKACAEARAAGQPPPARPDAGEMMQPDIAAIQRAWDWLGKYGGFTPPTQLEIGGEDRPLLDMAKLSPVELDALETSLAKAAGIIDVLDAAPAPVELEAPRQVPSKPVDPLGLLR